MYVQVRCLGNIYIKLEDKHTMFARFIFLYVEEASALNTKYMSTRDWDASSVGAI